MKSLPLLLSLFFITSCGQSQQEKHILQLAGGPCEGCEAIFEYGNKSLSTTDTLPGFLGKGKRIKLAGTVYQQDGKTPAKDVILYIYHTNQEGIYVTRGDETGWGKRHGYIRGWTRTGKDGKFAFYTLQPGTYPNRRAPAHIHLTLLEPTGRYYWLEDYYFKGDSLLTSNETAPKSPRGGSIGVMNLQEEAGILVGYRDITLGKNVPGY